MNPAGARRDRRPAAHLNPLGQRRNKEHVMANAPKRTGSPALKLCLTAGLLLLLGACAARQPAPEAPGRPAAPPAAEAPALGGRMTADAREYPWSALGRVNLAGQGFCTGVLIGPRQVLTQARCLYAARENRWFQARELHFIAAYQKDSFLADSKIADFAVAPGFSPQGGTSLANLTNNWALVTLQEPIGGRTGWLGLEWDSSTLKAAADRGEAAYLRAGYRSDWPHAVSLHFGCAAPQGGLVNPCEATPTELALPTFVVSSGELRVLADFYLHSASQGGSLATLTATPIRNNRLGRAQAPARDSLIGRQPTATAAQLLAVLGYDVSGGKLGEAAAAFRRDNALPPGEAIDFTLLATLVNAAARSGR
jgi:hypothetical protein